MRDVVEVFRVLEQHLNGEDVKHLCFLLHIEYDDLVGEHKFLQI